MINQSEIYGRYLRHPRLVNELKLKHCLIQYCVLGRLSGERDCEGKDFFNACYESVLQL